MEQQLLTYSAQTAQVLLGFVWRNRGSELSGPKVRIRPAGPRPKFSIFSLGSFRKTCRQHSGVGQTRSRRLFIAMDECGSLLGKVLTCQRTRGGRRAGCRPVQCGSARSLSAGPIMHVTRRGAPEETMKAERPPSLERRRGKRKDESRRLAEPDRGIGGMRGRSREQGPQITHLPRRRRGLHGLRMGDRGEGMNHQGTKTPRRERRGESFTAWWWPGHGCGGERYQP